ncbi:MAG: hypothetical protein ACXWGW_11800 [Methylobacter sp.]
MRHLTQRKYVKCLSFIERFTTQNPNLYISSQGNRGFRQMAPLLVQCNELITYRPDKTTTHKTEHRLNEELRPSAASLAATFGIADWPLARTNKSIAKSVRIKNSDNNPATG